ncbi:MAG: FecR family protein [Verrucomicrobiales bacterium]|nr:FecR family protein [Verrucomicrobiales bacterium]
MTDDRFAHLFESYVDRSIDEEGARELLEFFASDSTAKDRFVEDLRTSHLLYGLEENSDGESVVKEVLESIRLGNESPDITEEVMAEIRGDSEPVEGKVIRFFAWRRWGSAAAAVAAIAVAALVALSLMFNAQDHKEGLATLTHVIGAKWQGELPLNAGDELAKGRIHLLSGVARLDFANGVRVTLEGPTDFELIAVDEMRLHAGNLAAHVPPEGIGFLVHTEQAEVVDLGTTFGITVDANGKTEVAVFEGKVEVTSVQSREEKIIDEGSVVTFAKGSEKMIPKKLLSRSFRGWPVLFGVLNTGGRIRFVNAQPIRNPREVVDAENIIVFPERFGAVVDRPLAVTLTESGHYRTRDLIDHEVKLDLKGKRVNTYLLQFNPPYVEDAPNSDQVRFGGQVTFDRPVLAVITDRDLLKQSDPVLGKKRFEYDSTRARGLEHGDSLSLSEDRMTLSVDWLVMQSLKNGMDQVRVVVDAGE